jgi:hypothetical protein
MRPPSAPVFLAQALDITQFVVIILNHRYQGALAGLTVMFQSEDKRRTLALYTLARVAQCTYNALKKKARRKFVCFFNIFTSHNLYPPPLHSN